MNTNLGDPSKDRKPVFSNFVENHDQTMKQNDLTRLFDLLETPAKSYSRVQSTLSS